MEFYKLKIVVFYVFATTITSFDFKGSNEEEVREDNKNSFCCGCCGAREMFKKKDKEIKSLNIENNRLKKENNKYKE